MLVLMITWVATIPVEGIIGCWVHKEGETLVAGVQLKPGSTKQVDEQPSPLKLFLSSHCYPGLGNPFPQTLTTWREHSDGALGVGKVQVKPDSIWQFAEQPSPFPIFLSSHCYPGLDNPFPQRLFPGI